MNDDLEAPLVQDPQPAPKSEFEDKPHVAPKKPEHLPPSSDKDFWGDDADMHQLTPEEIEAKRQQVILNMSHTSVRREGPYIICTGCPFEHTLPLNADLFDIVDGHLQAKA